MRRVWIASAAFGSKCLEARTGSQLDGGTEAIILCRTFANVMTPERWQQVKEQLRSVSYSRSDAGDIVCWNLQKLDA
jgi:hypothetical protein